MKIQIYEDKSSFENKRDYREKKTPHGAPKEKVQEQHSIRSLGLTDIITDVKYILKEDLVHGTGN